MCQGACSIVLPLLSLYKHGLLIHREGKSTVLKAHTGTVRCVNFSNDGRMLLTGADDKTVKVCMCERPPVSAAPSAPNNSKECGCAGVVPADPALCLHAVRPPELGALVPVLRRWQAGCVRR